MMTSRSKPLASWDATRQQAYRAKHPESTFVFHLLLDASGSMYQHEAALRTAYNLYLRWLQHNAPPMSLVDVRCFGTTLQAKNVQALGLVSPLTTETYASVYGGTALYDALGSVVSQASEPGQHILVVFTDGQDCDSAQWSAGQVRELLRRSRSITTGCVCFWAPSRRRLKSQRSSALLPATVWFLAVRRFPRRLSVSGARQKPIWWRHHPSASCSPRAACFMKETLCQP